MQCLKARPIAMSVEVSRERRSLAVALVHEDKSSRSEANPWQGWRRNVPVSFFGRPKNGSNERCIRNKIFMTAALETGRFRLQDCSATSSAVSSPSGSDYQRFDRGQPLRLLLLRVSQCDDKVGGIAQRHRLRGHIDRLTPSGAASSLLSRNRARHIVIASKAASAYQKL